MSLYKRGSTWWVRVTTPNGEQIRRSARTSQRKEAQEYHDRLRVELWRVHQLGDTPRRTWQEAVERWLTETQHKASHMDDVRHLRWAHTHLYGRYLDEITRDVIDQVTAARLRDGVTNATVNRLLQVLRAILNRAARDWEWLVKAPAVRLLREPKRRVRWLTHDEAARLLSELPPHLAEMARFSLATGLREANVTGLSWTQVDLERRVAWIHADQSKNQKPLPVPLNADAVLVLRRQVGQHPTWVFTFQGHPVRKANNHAWRKALVRAGITDFRWHDLRHTWASWHIQQGTPLHVLQELGGWSDIRMVQRYAHLSADHLAVYADRLSQLRVISTNPAQSGDDGNEKRLEERLLTV
jgi:integrase